MLCSSKEVEATTFREAKAEAETATNGLGDLRHASGPRASAAGVSLQARGCVAVARRLIL